MVAPLAPGLDLEDAVGGGRPGLADPQLERRRPGPAGGRAGVGGGVAAVVTGAQSEEEEEEAADEAAAAGVDAGVEASAFLGVESLAAALAPAFLPPLS